MFHTSNNVSCLYSGVAMTFFIAIFHYLRNFINFERVCCSKSCPTFFVYKRFNSSDLMKNEPDQIINNESQTVLNDEVVTDKAMENITDVTVEECTKSRYITPMRLKYKQVYFNLFILVLNIVCLQVLYCNGITYHNC